MKRLIQIFVIGALVALLTTSASAQVPQMINYQGKLTNASGAPVNDTLQMVFSIYSDTGGTNLLWTETQPAVIVEKGVFNVLLGSVNPIPDSVFDGSIRYLGVKVGDDPEITPRKPMVSVGYAFHSGTADTAKYSMPDADWVINGDNIYHLNGNVGIGTETPSGPLRIRRAIPLDGGAHLDLDRTEDITKQAYISFSSGNHQDACIGLAPNKTDELNINAAKVGIGTTNPVYRLDIAGGHTRIQGANSLFFGNSMNDALSGLYNSGSSGNAEITLEAPAGTPRITVKNDGNVGIGTTSPTKKLHVAGESQFDGTINVATSSGMEIWGPGNWFNIGSDYGLALETTNDAAGIAFLTNNQARMAISGTGNVWVDGNVGIGTTSPRSKLDVNGVASCQNYLRIYGDLVNYHEIRHNGITGNLEIDPIGSLNLIVPDGNVGIGTTSPGAKLDVAGNALVNGSLTVNGPGGSINAITANTNGSYSGIAGLNSGTGPGIYAESYSTQSTTGAVTGKAKTDGGSGVYGETWSAGVIGGSSVAVFGWAPATGEGVGGAALGVLGKVGSYQKPDPPYSSVPAGVFGWATATSGVNAGVYGQTDSPNGFGVYSKGKLEVNGNINTNGTITAGSGSSRLGVGTYNPSYRIHVGEGAYCNGTQWVDVSSIKYKKDIHSLTPKEYQDILHKLAQTEVVRYRYKLQDDDESHLGVIAEYAPEEMVDAERIGMPTGDAIGFLMAALKAQQEEIEALKAKLKELESNR